MKNNLQTIYYNLLKKGKLDNNQIRKENGINNYRILSSYSYHHLIMLSTLTLRQAFGKMMAIL